MAPDFVIYQVIGIFILVAELPKTLASSREFWESVF